jgi:hypothetical protein
MLKAFTSTVLSVNPPPIAKRTVLSRIEQALNWDCIEAVCGGAVRKDVDRRPFTGDCSP